MNGIFEVLKCNTVRAESMPADCIECGAEISLHHEVETGEIVDCGTCGAELEVVGVDPILVDTAPELEEDWGE